MRMLLSPDEMRALERGYMDQWGVPSIELMERAAARVLDVLEERLGRCEGHCVHFACGPGGNGGDGYAAARLFAARGGRAVVVSASDESELGGDALINCQRAHATPRCFFHPVEDLDALPAPDMWVDALFGIGLSRPLSGGALALARRMNRDGCVLAVDIPSGLSGQTGRALDEAVRAGSTITFEREKLGHYLGDGQDLCGELIVRSIGIPDAALPGDAALLVEDCDLAPLRAPRLRNTHKGTYGHLLIVAGSAGMAGASAIAAQAALRTGAGLVTVACPASIVPIVQALAPCATCLPLPERCGSISGEAAPVLSDALRGMSAAAVGPGLSRLCAPAVVEAVLKSDVPAAVDADALNLVSTSDALRALLRPHHVVTPHPGEAARLLGRPCGEPVPDARALREMGCTALLKGAATVIAGERTYISASGTPGMAKGGSGDALTGILGALLARGHAPEDAAWMASHLHGLAGERATATVGEAAMLVTDLVGYIGGVLRDG